MPVVFQEYLVEMTHSFKKNGYACLKNPALSTNTMPSSWKLRHVSKDCFTTCLLRPVLHYINNQINWAIEILCIHMYRCTSDIFHCCAAKKNNNKTKKQNQGETQTPYEVAFVFICVFLLVLGLWGWVGQGCFIFFWDFSFEMKAERLDGSTACPGALVAEQQNRTKTKKTKKHNFEETFWFRLQRWFFLVFLVFFWFFLVSKSKRTKNTWCFLVFWWLPPTMNLEKPKNTRCFLVFWSSKPKKTKKHKENKKKKTSLESKPKSLLKVLVFWFFGFPCVFGFWYFSFLNNSKLSPTEEFLQQTFVFQ